MIMKNMQKKNQGNALLLVLWLVVIVLALIIATGTAYAFISKNLSQGRPVYTIPAKEAPPLQADNIFNGLGRIRALSADKQPETVIVSIAFPYDKADVPFVEELASKISDFRTLTLAFFSELPASELRGREEDALKAELLGRYNAILTLGRIPLLYFNDFMILE